MLPRTATVLVLSCILFIAGCSIYTGVVRPPEFHTEANEKNGPGALMLVLIVNADAKENSVSVQDTAIETCAVFRLPDFEPLPAIPQIPESMSDDHQKISNHLLDHIIELRAFEEEERIEIKEAYRQYLQGCGAEQLQ